MSRKSVLARRTFTPTLSLLFRCYRPKSPCDTGRETDRQTESTHLQDS